MPTKAVFTYMHYVAFTFIPTEVAGDGLQVKSAKIYLQCLRSKRS